MPARFNINSPFARIYSDPSMGPESLLDLVLEDCKFWKYLEQKRKSLGMNPDVFKILIIPDLDIFESHSSTGTDPTLVEHWISLLSAKGYTSCTVAAAENDAANWLANREVEVLADLAGYHYITKEGVSYDVANLTNDIENDSTDKCSMFTVPLSSAWTNAHFRIIFSKNKTDEEFYYSLCLKTLLDILPQRSKGYHYYFRLQPEELAHTLCKRNDVDFCMVDAYTSNHGMQGARHQKKLQTNTFIAGNNVLLTDWFGALKMGLDPYSSSINGYVLRKIGLPKKYFFAGNLAVYSGWRNVPKLLAESVISRNRNPLMRQLSKAWLQKTDSTLFPFKNPMDAQVNKAATSILNNVEKHPIALSLMTGMNYFIAALGKTVENWNILFDKEKLFRRRTELGFDVDNFSKDDFENVENYILPLAQIASSTLPDANGLKWRYIDESVLFEFTRTLPYDYNHFIEKFEIARSVQYMFDNIGGARFPVKKDKRGKILYQAERDIYLPQPNWMAIFGGKPIDVCKIEVIRYKRNSQTIYWRTVKSPNNSATFDDGLVSILAKNNGAMQIKIVARQKFTLPLFWQVFNIDYAPTIKDVLVSDAYSRFFTRTMANFEAVYEGRNPAIGREPDREWGDDNNFRNPLQAEQLRNLLGMITGVVEQLFGKNKENAPDQITDSDGYRHFNGEQSKNETFETTMKSFILDVSTAIQKDFAHITTGK